MTTNHGYVKLNGSQINFPAATGAAICWNLEIEIWCAKNNHLCEHKDPFWAYAFLTKGQIFNFLTAVYDPLLSKDDERLSINVMDIREKIDAALNDDDEYTVTGFDY